MWIALPNLFAARMDDLVYAELLFFSVMCSVVVRYIKASIVRQVLSAIIGVSMVYYFTGVRVLYSMVTVLIAVFIHLFTPYRYMGVMSFIILFLYLGVLRSVHYFGLPPLESHANAVQLILTLRLVGLGYEAQASMIPLQCKTDNSTFRLRTIPKLKIFDIISYSYYFPGLFTDILLPINFCAHLLFFVLGPYYTYAMYHDVISNEHIRNVSVWSHIKWRIYHLLWTCPAFLIFVHLYPLNTLRKPEFCSETAFYKIYVGIFIFFWMRCRMYSAWMVAESICILNGIGIYPKSFISQVSIGPKKDSPELTFSGHIETSSEAIRNADIFKVEFDSTFRQTVRAWNRSVQFWLATFVYKRVPKTFGVFLTMIVSAYWHGVHPGYYLAFISFPLCVLAEDSLFELFSKDSMGNPPVIVRATWFVVKHLGLAYMAAGFLLLSYSDTVQYWRSLHFYFHWLMGTIIFCCWIRKALQTLWNSADIKGLSRTPLVNFLNQRKTIVNDIIESDNKKRQ
uniref:Lysophospholipid acyltransferase 7 n=1 Tax=Syphacia muris TaxID=451379 RepID=A0A0N5ASU9_9BILA